MLKWPGAYNVCMPGQLFEDLTDIYEAMVDWPKRLANEGPFYRRVFEPLGVRSVVDVACGTGQHAAMFHSWGLRVEGADISQGMIERARTAFGEPPGLRWVVRGYEEPIAGREAAQEEKPDGEREEYRFDVAVCVGNSLALAPNASVAEQAVRQMLVAVRPGGVVIIQVLNLWRLADGPCLWQKSVRAKLPPGEVLILKGVHRCGKQGYVDLALLDPASGQLLHSESLPFLGLEAENLEHQARQAGAGHVEFFGGYQGQPYQRGKSVDLVMVARLETEPHDTGTRSQRPSPPR